MILKNNRSSLRKHEPKFEELYAGFKKEQMRVQVTAARVLKISGERQISNNKYRRFRKEIQLPLHLDTNTIAAKFESGILYIKLLKHINKNNNEQQNVPTQEPKKDEEEKPKKENGKAEELKKDDDVKNKVEERPETMRVVSKLRPEYVNALCGLFDEIKKKKKKFLNLLLLALMFGLYVKNVIKSIFSGGHKSQE